MRGGINKVMQLGLGNLAAAIRERIRLGPEKSKRK